jgi:hypothetical protein
VTGLSPAAVFGTASQRREIAGTVQFSSLPESTKAGGRAEFLMRRALGLLLATLMAAAIAQLSPARAQPASHQIQLSEKQVLSFIAAQPDMSAAVRKWQGLVAETPSAKVQAEFDAVAKKHGFKDFTEYDEVSANITMVMAGIDPQSKEFTEPAVAIKKEIEAITADKTIPDDEKKQFLEELNEALKATVPVQFPSNIELVLKHYEKLDAALN